MIKGGETRIISPVGRRWDDLFARGPRVSEDFMSDRQQSAMDEREAFCCCCKFSTPARSFED
jgi:antitoxin VapB